MMYATALALFGLLATTTSAQSSDSGLIVIQTSGPEDCDEKTSPGHHLRMHYTGTIDESSATGVGGTQFDSSIPRGTTFDFPLGGGRVIRGWDEGLVGLCKGAKATLIIPPELGYGDQGAGGVIPGGATLRFEVEVVDFSTEPPAPSQQDNLFVNLDVSPTDGKLSKEEVLAFFKAQGKDELPPGMWEHEDKNGDGFISWGEFSGPKGHVDVTAQGEEL